MLDRKSMPSAGQRVYAVLDGESMLNARLC
jgi:hypothetical protein